MPTILLIGYDEHLSLSMAYALRKEPVRLVLLTHRRDSVARYSRFISKVHWYSGYDETLEAVRRVAQTEQIDLILPFDEVESVTASLLREQLESIAPLVPLTSPRTLEAAIDKGRLYSLLQEAGLNVMPRSRVATGRDLETHDGLGMSFPILIKPGRGSYGRGIQEFQDEIELRKHLSRQSTFGCMLQEYIQGSDITCNVIAEKGRVLVHTIQESPNKDIGNYNRNDDLRFKQDGEVLDLVSRVVGVLDWDGVACFDLHRRASDGRVFLLEINGRFWGSLVSSLDVAGVNFPLFMVRRSLGLPDLQVKSREGEQYSLHQAVSRFVRGHFKAPLHTKYRAYLVDPFARIAKYRFFGRFTSLLRKTVLRDPGSAKRPRVNGTGPQQFLSPTIHP